LLKNS
jgi:hypothetical protein